MKTHRVCSRCQRYLTLRDVAGGPPAWCWGCWDAAEAHKYEAWRRGQLSRWLRRLLRRGEH